jgi:precorrin-3B synthase
MTTPIIQGRCPGAFNPMMSGDGLVVRVRPRLARLTRDQILGLCAAAQRFGNATIDLTNRANLQLRGVSQEAYDPLMQALAALDLLDHDPGVETRRNILVTPFYAPDDLTSRLTQSLLNSLPQLPELPPKFGFVIDTGPARLLAGVSGDIRLERADNNTLILRADGAQSGRIVSEDEAMDRLTELALWFAENTSPRARRMGALVAQQALPDIWTGAQPAPQGETPEPGQTPSGPLVGAPFGQIPAQALADLIHASRAHALRVTPWRLFLLEGGSTTQAPGFVTTPDDPSLRTDACPGAPFCPQAQVETRDIARQLAARVRGTLHVSGCAKGCAHPGPASITLVGRQGRFDLVKQGRVGDEPVKRDLTIETLLCMTDF